MWKQKIDRLNKRYKLFTDEFAEEELNAPRRAINENEDTLIIQRAYEWIEEVDYYLTARIWRNWCSRRNTAKGEQLREISLLDGRIWKHGCARDSNLRNKKEYGNNTVIRA